MDFVERIDRLFDIQKQYFVVYGQSQPEYKLDEVLKYSNTQYIGSVSNLPDVSILPQAEMIIFHCLIGDINNLIYFRKLAAHNVILAWSIWGGDLYDTYRYNHSLKAIIKVKPVIKELFRKALIKNIDVFITRGDYVYLKKHYKTSKNSVNISAGYSYHFLPIKENASNKNSHIMIGHNAMRSCRHIETFEMISEYADKVEVYCPLSYPKNPEYVNIVCEKGRSLFHDRFHPLLDFMNYNEYIDFLNSIDIGIFNNSRQQGIGNITNLLYFGKKIYMSEDNSNKTVFKYPDYKVFDIREIAQDDFLVPLSYEDAKQNRENILNMYSDENFKAEWSNVFKCIYSSNE